MKRPQLSVAVRVAASFFQLSVEPLRVKLFVEIAGPVSS